MDSVLVYELGSESIRQMPENYLIAHFNGHRWVSEPDLAANRDLAVRVYLALFDHGIKYNRDGLCLLGRVTPNVLMKGDGHVQES